MASAVPFSGMVVSAHQPFGFARASRHKYRAERVRRLDLRNIVEPSTNGSCPICSDNQRDHLNAGRLFVMFIPAMACVSIPAMTFGCILLLQVELAITHPCTRYWAFRKLPLSVDRTVQTACRASARWFRHAGARAVRLSLRRGCEYRANAFLAGSTKVGCGFF